MNLSETLQSRGLATASVNKAQDMMTEHLLSDDPASLDASFGIGNDSFHWGLMDIVPPKNSTLVANPGDELDKKRRKSKKFRKYEAKLIQQQDTGPRRTLVQTTGADTSDTMDYSRSCWFV